MTAKKFYSKVSLGESCWHWMGKVNKLGYGKLESNGKYYAAHRFAYILEFGEIPNGLFVCHHCDNPSCVRIGHLFLGTQRDNLADRDKKARGKRIARWSAPHLENNRAAKLRWPQVLEIREKAKSGCSPLEIAKMFGVVNSTVRRIINNTAWVQH